MRITTNINDLNFRCSDVEDYKQGITIGKKLIMTCMFGKNKNAVGLAHNQIRGNKNVYIVKSKNVFRAFVNAKVVDFSQDVFRHEESCMSFPNKANKVDRHTWITISHLIKDGYVQETFNGFEACIHQHEIDHLNGIDIHHKTKEESYNE